MRHNCQKLMTLIPDLRGRLAESTLEGHPWKATLSVLMSGHEDRSFSLSTQVRFLRGKMPISTMSSHGGAFLCGKCPFTKPHVESQRSVLHGKFSIYKPQVEPWRSIFAWEIPIYKLNLLPGGAFSCGEISIYKLNWSVSCGKFLFTNSTSVFSLFTNYLQTSFLREKAIFRHGHIKIQSLIGGFLTMDRSPEKCFFP